MDEDIDNTYNVSNSINGVGNLKANVNPSNSRQPRWKLASHVTQGRCHLVLVTLKNNASIVQMEDYF